MYETVRATKIAFPQSFGLETMLSSRLSLALTESKQFVFDLIGKNNVCVGTGHAQKQLGFLLAARP